MSIMKLIMNVNNTRALINVINGDSNENRNRNLDSSNNFISIMTRGY